MSDSTPRPQDRLLLREGAAQPTERLIEPRSALLWTVLSLPVVGYFVWYYHAQRDCARLLDDGSDPWFWMTMLFPGMLLVVPYAVAQARVVARVEVASRMPLRTTTYLALCAGGFLIPALLPLVLQGRLNHAARTNPAQLRRLRTA
jgi:hypothetical protein